MEFIRSFDIQILETFIIVVVLVVLNLAFRKWSSRIARKFHLDAMRRKITVKVMNLILLLVGIILITGIWGLDQEQLFLFISSTITVLGIGFFAVWSILSNITAGILLFFNHPLHIGDTIRIMDKELPVEGRVRDISMFFMHIETSEGELVTIPNSLITQKIVSVIPDPERKKRNNLSKTKKQNNETE